MPRGKPKKKIVDPSQFAYTSKFNGAVIRIANIVYNNRKIRKKDVRDMIHISNDTFENVLIFLDQIKMIDIKMVYEDTLSINEGSGSKVKYLFWKGFQTPAMCEEINHLVEFYNIDLNDYPIRDMHKITDEQKIILKKYIWKINHTNGKITSYKLHKIFDFLDYEIFSRMRSIVDIFKVHWNQLYDAVSKLMKQGKIELGMNNQYVVIYKDPEFLAKKKKWICENCNYQNLSKNIFCGGCGSKKEK